MSKNGAPDSVAWLHHFIGALRTLNYFEINITVTIPGDSRHQKPVFSAGIARAPKGNLRLQNWNLSMKTMVESNQNLASTTQPLLLPVFKSQALPTTQLERVNFRGWHLVETTCHGTKEIPRERESLCSSRRFRASLGHAFSRLIRFQLYSRPSKTKRKLLEERRCQHP